MRPLAEARSVVGSKLFLSAKALATLLAVVLLLGEVESQVVLHGQPVGVCGVADIAMVLSDLVKVFVVGQAACMPVCLATLIACKGTPPAFRLVKFLGPRCSCRGVGFLEAMVGMAIFDSHSVALGGLSSHTLHLGWSSLLEAGSIGASADQTLGPMLLMETQVVDQLLLNLEGLTTFFTLVPEEREKLRK